MHDAADLVGVRAGLKKIAYKRAFRSITFSFDRVELTVLEECFTIVMSLLPPWLSQGIFQDMKELLADEDAQAVVLSPQADDNASVRTTSQVIDSQGLLKLKIKSNFFCFDGALLLWTLRIYSGHSDEKTTILADAKRLDLKASTKPSIAEVSRILTQLTEDWQALEKFDIFLDEPSQLWNKVYEQLTAVSQDRQGNMAWEVFRGWLGQLVLSQTSRRHSPVVVAVVSLRPRLPPPTRGPLFSAIKQNCH